MRESVSRLPSSIGREQVSTIRQANEGSEALKTSKAVGTIGAIERCVETDRLIDQERFRKTVSSVREPARPRTWASMGVNPAVDQPNG